jgi:beta-galactosidase
MNNSMFDRIAIFKQPIPIGRLFSEDSPELRKASSLWLDFESEDVKGEYFSLGIGGRTYGMVWPDRTPQPELWQVKKSAQPVHTEWKDASKGVVEITNRFAFTNLNELNSSWQLEADDLVLQKGDLNISLQGGEKTQIIIPFTKPDVKPGVSYRILISFQTKEDQFWARKGYEMAWDQLDLPYYQTVTEQKLQNNSRLNVAEGDSKLTVSGNGFTYIFDQSTGNLSGLNFGGTELVKQGPVLNVWRAPLVNETDPWANGGAQLRDRQPGMGNGPVNNWYSLGINQLTFKLDQLQWSENGKNQIVIKVNNHADGTTYQTAFSNSFTYTICADGEMTINHTVTPHGTMPSWLPKVGLQWALNQSLENVKWNGRGPFENYPDRKTGAKLGIYSKTVGEFVEPYLKPQDYGCRTDNRWVSFQNKEGIGIHFSGEKLFNFSAQSYGTAHLGRAQYPYQLIHSNDITFNFDYATSGVGCTAISVLNEYRVLPSVYTFVSKVKPFQMEK